MIIMNSIKKFKNDYHEQYKKALNDYHEQYKKV